MQTAYETTQPLKIETVFSTQGHGYVFFPKLGGPPAPSSAVPGSILNVLQYLVYHRISQEHVAHVDIKEKEGTQV